MPRGGFREGAGRPKSGRKVHTIRATDEEWKLIKAYSEQVKRMQEVKKQEDLLTKEDALKVAKKYAEENNLVIGRYIGENWNAYYWDVDDLSIKNKFIGWPFWLEVDKLGEVLVDNSPLGNLVGGDEIEDDE